MRDINKELEELRETLPKNVEIGMLVSFDVTNFNGNMSEYVLFTVKANGKTVMKVKASRAKFGINFYDEGWNKFLLEYAKIAHTLYKEEEYEDGEYYWVTLLDGSEPRIMWFFQGEWFSECRRFTFKSAYKVISKIERPEL